MKFTRLINGTMKICAGVSILLTALIITGCKTCSITMPCCTGAGAFAQIAKAHKSSPSSQVDKKESEKSQPTTSTQPAQADANKQPALAQTKPADSEGWEYMFDGRTLEGWQEIDYPGKGEVKVKDGQIILSMGIMTGIKWTNEPPRMNYEVEYEAMRVDGSDFFGSLTFLVDKSPCTFILGGWGGGTVGISSLDDMDASENETTKYINFENGKWYKIRIRITPKKIEAWINNDKVIDVVHTGKKISLRPGDIELSQPFGFSTWSTTGALRNIRIRTIKPVE